MSHAPDRSIATAIRRLPMAFVYKHKLEDGTCGPTGKEGLWFGTALRRGARACVTVQASAWQSAIRVGS